VTHLRELSGFCSLIMDIRWGPSPCGFAPSFLYGPSDTIAVRPGLDHVCPVGDAIEQRLAEQGVRDHLGPLQKGQVGG
jgi:hypothetical protein